MNDLSSVSSFTICIRGSKCLWHLGSGNQTGWVANTHRKTRTPRHLCPTLLPYLVPVKLARVLEGHTTGFQELPLVSEPLRGLFGTTGQTGLLDLTVFLAHSLRGPWTCKCPHVPGISDTEHAKGYSIFMMPLLERKQGPQLLLPKQRLRKAKRGPESREQWNSLNITIFCFVPLSISLPHSTLHLVNSLALCNIPTSDFLTRPTLP